MARLYLLSRLDRAAKRSPRLFKLAGRIESLIVGSLFYLSRRLSPDRASALGDRLGGMIGPRLKKHRDVIDNLTIAFPDWPPDRLRATAAAIWRQAGRTVMEFPHLDVLCSPAAADRIEVVFLAEIGSVARGEEPAIFVSAHLGNWNLATVAATRLNLPLSVIYSPQRNPYLERLLGRYRDVIGADAIDSGSAGRAIMEALRRGRSVGLVMDQRFEGGELVPFFGVAAPTAVAPARVAVKLGIDFIPVRVERLNGARFRVTVYEPVRRDPEIADPRLAALAMTARVNAIFESWIRETPEQWLCAKRRWPRHAVPCGSARSPGTRASLGTAGQGLEERRRVELIRGTLGHLNPSGRA